MKKTHLFTLALLAGSFLSTHALHAADEWGDGTRVLHIGGGGAHDYDRWFKDYDGKLINDLDGYTARYYEPPELTPELVKSADVLLISANKAFPDKAVREAVFAHADEGKGMIVLHAGLWYSWRDWSDFNKVVAGGGSRGHDRLGEFEVKVTQPDHALVKDVPASFKITDELYYFEPDSSGTPITVLATAHSDDRDKAYPQVFTVNHPKARIVGLTLGHDGRAHEHAAFQKLLVNSLDWVAKK